MFINHTAREVTAKIVYYGPGLSGKTTNLQYIFSVTNDSSRGKLVSIETNIERTLFFDLLPINVGLIKGYRAKFQLYTVPGQVFYNATRKMVLKGVDGIVFVADSQSLMERSNIDSLKNLKENLGEYNKEIDDLPFVIQYNKRDLSHIYSLDKMNSQLNPDNRYDYFESIAIEGKGVVETLRRITGLTLLQIKETIDTEAKIADKNTNIDFDLNKNREMIRKDDLPIKKMSYDMLENIRDEHYLETDEDPAPTGGQVVMERRDIGKRSRPVAAAREQEETVKGPDTNPVEEPRAAVGSGEKNFDLLDRMRDQSRITVLKKIPRVDSDLDIDIKDQDGNLIESIKVYPTKKTKKITIIVDLK
jgi:signal recognition particle receptor subunit beta